MNTAHHSLFGAAVSLLFVLTGNLFVLGQLSEQPHDLATKAKICSVYGVAIANAEAIQTGDVLILERRFFDGVWPHSPWTGGTLTEVILTRVIFDDLNHRFLTLSRNKSEWLELEKIENGNDGRLIRISDQGLLWRRSSKLMIRKREKEIHRLSSDNEKSLEGLDMIYYDPRSAGFYYGSLGPLRPALERYRDRLTGEMLIDSTLKKNALEIRLEAGRMGDDSRQVWCNSFDLADNLPVRTSWYVESLKNKDRSTSHSFQYQWKELSGLHVPIRVKGSTVGSYLDPQGKHRDAKETTEICMHWFSINEEFEDSDFGESRLRDSKQFQDLIDPVKSGATHLEKILKGMESGALFPKLDGEE